MNINFDHDALYKYIDEFIESLSKEEKQIRIIQEYLLRSDYYNTPRLFFNRYLSDMFEYGFPKDIFDGKIFSSHFYNWTDNQMVNIIAHYPDYYAIHMNVYNPRLNQLTIKLSSDSQKKLNDTISRLLYLIDCCQSRIFINTSTIKSIIKSYDTIGEGTDNQ